MNVEHLIEMVFQSGGNELHMKIGSKPLMRKNNALKQMDFPALVEQDMKDLQSELLTEDEIAKFEKIGVYESNHFGKAPCNFRLSLFHSQQKPIAYIKIINSNVPSIQDIGFPESAANLLSAAKGLFILSGPARSGISTSMAALVEYMNNKFRRHILVIEDPIEYYYQPKESIISQRQFSKDIYMIEQGINFAKRMDVDTLVIGDLKRDIPFKNIIEYVAGGHLVILCMQNLGFTSTLEKLVFSFPESYREYVNVVLSENLIGVCSQALITNTNGRRVPVHEILIPNKNSAGIISMGKYAQLRNNIATAGSGSILFDTDKGRPGSVAEKLAKGDLEKAAADAFLEYYKSTMS